MLAVNIIHSKILKETAIFQAPWQLKIAIFSYHFFCLSSLRGKRFRVVSEQRATEERRGTGFSVLVARKIEREWSLILITCSESARKHLRKISYVTRQQIQMCSL